MIHKTFIAGFGGQGVLSLGQLWIYCAEKSGLQVSYFPYYAPEKRGGVVHASVIISDKKITNPLVTWSDSSIVMHKDSMAAAEQKAKAGSLVLINSDLVEVLPKRNDIQIITLACNTLAKEIGDVKVANMVMMGALAMGINNIEFSNLENILSSYFPPGKASLVPLNVKAFEAGRVAFTKRCKN